jgi:NADPH:quinone reductase-like Zn-dependent oxidoreductase
MDIIRIHTYGGPNVLELEQTPEPEPGPGEILIRVGSASVNWSDTMRRRNDPYPFPTPLPFTPGGEVAGVVAALGAGVEGPPLGAHVLALAGPDGSTGYAQFALADASRVVPIPPGVSEDVASTILVAGTTPLLMLSHAARLREGESVLVPAAAGGVGSYSIQLAKRLGAATVIGLASSEAKRARALDLGADHALNPGEPDWPAKVRELTGGQGVDVALEATGGSLLEDVLSVLAPFGRCVVFGYASRQPATLSSATIERLLYRPALNQTLMGFNIGAFFGLRPEVAGPAIGQLLKLVADGAVKVPVARTLPLRQAALAHELLESREVIGKIVLKPWEM